MRFLIKHSCNKGGGMLEEVLLKCIVLNPMGWKEIIVYGYRNKSELLLYIGLKESIRK